MKPNGTRESLSSEAHRYLTPLATGSMTNSLYFIFLIYKIEITILLQDCCKRKTEPMVLIPEAYILLLSDDLFKRHCLAHRRVSIRICQIHNITYIDEMKPDIGRDIARTHLFPFSLQFHPPLSDHEEAENL